MTGNPTIAAIATPAGAGAVSIIRLSGAGTLTALSAVAKVPPHAWRPRQMRLVDIFDFESGEKIDEALAVWFPGPGSFTGEDVCEIQGHGGQVVTARVLKSVLKAGARPAEPGEFTRRAFLNGRLDLTRAEAIADLVGARGEAEAALAVRQLSGRLAERIQALREAVFSALVELTADIDFSDDLEPLDLSALKERLLTGVQPGLADLLQKGLAGRPFRQGVSLALVGAPNVGKSSLFNALADDERALVSQSPGTTRDYITTRAIWRGLNVELCDTAGLSARPLDELDALGQERSLKRLAEADLVLWVRDSARPGEDGGLGAEKLPPGKTVVVWNKADLAAPPPAEAGEVRAVVSARHGQGLDELKALILKLVTGDSHCRAPEVAPNARHQAALAEAEAGLKATIAALDQGQPPDICAFELGGVLKALDRICGRSTADDVLNEIFGRFCLGK